MSAPTAKELILLGAIGIGVYWIFSRQATQAVANPAAAQAATYARNDAALWSSIGKIIGAVAPEATKAYQAANASKSGPVSTAAGTYIGDEAVYNPLASSAIDGLAWNPVGFAPADYLSSVTFDTGPALDWSGAGF